MPERTVSPTPDARCQTPDARRQSPDEGDSSAARAGSAAEADGPRPAADAFGRKCPYLAGRPPHGSHHAWPSSVNVCYARPRAEKAYGPVNKKTQAERCFCGREVYETCADFESARGRGLELPVFDGKTSAAPGATAASEPRPGYRRERRKRRHRRSSARQWLVKSSQSWLVSVFWLLIIAGSCWMVLRSR